MADRIPPDIWNEIFAFCDPLELVKSGMSLICKQWHSCLQNPRVWLRKCAADKVRFSLPEDFEINRHKINWYNEYKCWYSDKLSRRRAFEYLKAGKNLFVTGGAGVGKSVFLKEIVGALKNRNPWMNAQLPGGGITEAYYTPLNTAVTASTGVAALLIGGSTLHHWAGLGLADEPIETIKNKSIREMKWFERRRENVRKTWMETDVLVIDEVSVLHPDFINKLDQFGRFIRGNPDKPFGGIQLVMFGDFCQLSPIPDKENPSPKGYLFELDQWNELAETSIKLEHVHRQNDTEFALLLKRVRLGCQTLDDLKVLRSCLDTKLGDNVVPIRLVPRRIEAEEINLRELAALTPVNTLVRGKSAPIVLKDTLIEYRSERSISGFSGGQKESIDLMDKLIKSQCPTKDKLSLCEGAQVMLVVNLDPINGLVNGSCGVVTHFHAKTLDKLPVVKFSNGTQMTMDWHEWKMYQPGVKKKNAAVILYKQIPLVHGWAITIHKWGFFHALALPSFSGVKV